ncbi:MAG: ATP-binding protein, partial [Promethearchaeota archaeon]
FRLLDVVDRTPFMLSYNDGSPFWFQPLQVAAVIGRPAFQQRFIDDENSTNSFTDLILQSLIEPPLYYGLLQIIFQGKNFPKTLETTNSTTNKGYKRKTPKEQYLEQETLDFWRTGSFVGEVRILLMDFNRTRVYQAQTALSSLLRHYGLQTSQYPCWYKLKRLTPVLTAMRKRQPLKWQPLNGKRLAQFLKLPIRQYPGLQRLSPHLLSFKPPPKTANGIIMGKPIIDGKESHMLYHISLEDLSNHMGIWGTTGMGKSRFVYGLIRELSLQGFPVTIFDPKGEYTDLANDLEEIILIRPGSTDLPFHLNILEVPPNLTEEDHLGFLHSTLMNIFLTQDFHMQPQMGAVLMKALRYCITNHLTFEEMLNSLEWPETKLSSDLGVQGTNLEASAHAVANRLRVLTFGICREIFLGETSISIDKLLNTCCVIDLSTFENVESIQARKVFLEVFSHYILNYLRKTYHSTHEPGEIEHIFVIEEAQKLVPQKMRPIYSDEQSLLGKLPWTLRGYGVSLIYSGTEPTVEPPILNNTGMTVMFHSKYNPDILANLLGIRKDEYIGYREAQSLLGPQQHALISQKGQAGIFLLKVKDVPKQPISPFKLLKLQEKLTQTNLSHSNTRKPIKYKKSTLSPSLKVNRQINDKKTNIKGKFWFGKRGPQNKRFLAKEKATSSQEITNIWYEAISAYEVNEKDRFFRKLSASIEQAIKLKHQEVFGYLAPTMKIGMTNLCKEGWINERQSNLEWFWNLRNKFAHIGIDLNLEELARARQIGEKIIRGCLGNK